MGRPRFTCLGHACGFERRQWTALDLIACLRLQQLSVVCIVGRADAHKTLSSMRKEQACVRQIWRQNQDEMPMLVDALMWCLPRCRAVLRPPWLAQG